MPFRGAEVLSIGRDVTERHIADSKLAASEARFRNLAEKSADVVWSFVSEPTPHFDNMSPSVENILGYPPSYFLDDFTRMLAILDDEGRTAIARALIGERILTRFDFHFRHADGSIVIGETQTTVIHYGLQGVSRDVTELRHLQCSVAALALRDPLTGLANRRLFNELLTADLARTQRSGIPFAVAFLDLDGLNNVNDILRPRRRRSCAVRDSQKIGLDCARRRCRSPTGRRRVRHRLWAERPDFKEPHSTHRRSAVRTDQYRLQT